MARVIFFFFPKLTTALCVACVRDSCWTIKIIGTCVGRYFVNLLLEPVGVFTKKAVECG